MAQADAYASRMFISSRLSLSHEWFPKGLTEPFGRPAPDAAAPHWPGPGDTGALTCTAHWAAVRTGHICILSICTSFIFPVLLRRSRHMTSYKFKAYNVMI